MAPGAFAARVWDRAHRLQAADVVARIWDRDVSVWGADRAAPEVADRLGWLDLPATMRARSAELTAFAEDVRARFDRVVLCGMGGSSLAPEVLWRVFGPREGFPSLHLLDSTHPEAIRAAVSDDALGRTLFLIASKSGTTLETASFDRHFWERTGQNGDQFVAITDPGTSLAASARTRGFRGVFESPADVGGRYSALSPFGIVPAALIGVDVERLLARAAEEAVALRRDLPDNEGALLGAAMGEGALVGRDKLTIVLAPRLASFGLWVEQLVAESTGKRGKGIVPVTGEAPELLSGTEPDRVYLMRRYGDAAEPDLNALAARLEEAQAPVDAVRLTSPYDLGAEFLRLEFAVAVAGAVLGINPFDQPNVAESKDNTRRMLDTGAPPPPASDLAALRHWLRSVGPGDYVAVMAYLAPTPDTDARLRRLRRLLAERLDVAVTVGYGPRFLHSTGQLHKGGPPRGRFLQIVDHPARDVPIPGEPYGFRRLIGAQADGDLAALRERGCPVLRVDDWRILAEELGT